MAPLQPPAQPGPLLQQPPAAVGAGLEAQDDVPRVAPAAPERVVPVFRQEREQAGGGVLPAPEGVGQQPVAHGGDLVVRLEVGIGLGGAEGEGDASRLAALRPRDLPRGEGDLLGEDDLDGVARAEGVADVVDQSAEGGLILTRQDGSPSGHTVLD